ncbi:unnamed protein product [Cuscuta epithymum]|uniref:Uncharacterized protein n=1 Tax=Cuscuta epithymum TaxID=186058 RepID=A0AAV0EL80_9ASTE|nr:unnamed protein product [Cuscuta epithymum]CAH9124490.1 unnamed protein product [Cuscuta epithymum]
MRIYIISFVLLLAFGKARLSLCDLTLQCSKPEPNDECWKLIMQYIQNDGNDGRVPPTTYPFPDCCPEVRNLGKECFWYWVYHENDKMAYGDYDITVIYLNIIDTWNQCQDKRNLTNLQNM